VCPDAWAIDIIKGTMAGMAGMAVAAGAGDRRPAI
jgi:hypothetical protein